MSETRAQSDAVEDIPRMSSMNTLSSPDSSNVSRNGQVTGDLEIGMINASVDEG